MSMSSPIPKTLEGVKRLARRLKALDGLTHARALDRASVIAGHPNFKSMKRTLDAEAKSLAAGGPSKSRKGPPSMPTHQFHRESVTAWDAANAALDVSPGASETWRSPSAIVRALNPVMGVNLNHSLLPTGGGLDFEGVTVAREPGCLEFSLGRRSVYIVKPKVLTFERLDDKGESFFLLELDSLKPSGVYDRDEEDEDEEASQPRRVRESEELLELSPGNYVSRDIWDRGFLGYRGDGSEIPLPASARLVSRFFGGKILIVAKASLWNSAAETYDGRHNRMTSAQIRNVIERSIAAAA